MATVEELIKGSLWEVVSPKGMSFGAWLGEELVTLSPQTQVRVVEQDSNEGIFEITELPEGARVGVRVRDKITITYIFYKYLQAVS